MWPGCPDALVGQTTRVAAQLRTAVAEQEPFALHYFAWIDRSGRDVSEDPGVACARSGRRVRFGAVPEAVRAWVVGVIGEVSVATPCCGGPVG